MSVEAYINFSDGSNRYMTACYGALGISNNNNKKIVSVTTKLDNRIEKPFYDLVKDSVFGKYFPEYEEARINGVTLDASKFSGQYIVTVKSILRYVDEFQPNYMAALYFKKIAPEASANAILYLAHYVGYYPIKNEFYKTIIGNHYAFYCTMNLSQFDAMLNMETLFKGRYTCLNKGGGYVGRDNIFSNKPKSNSITSILMERSILDTKYDPFSAVFNSSNMRIEKENIINTLMLLTEHENKQT